MVPMSGICCSCRNCVKDANRKAKDQFKWKKAKNAENYKKKFFKYINKRQVQNKNIDLLLNRKDELVTNNGGKAEVLNSFFTCHHQHCWAPSLGNKKPDNANTEPLSVMEELVCEFKPDPTNPWALTIFS